jgi:hypothetical protein
MNRTMPHGFAGSLLIALLTPAAGLSAQAVEEDFSGGVPSEAPWSASPDAAVVEPEFGGPGAALALPAEGSFLQTAVTSPSAVTFWRAPARPGDDYTLILRTRCGDAETRTAWRRAPADLPTTAFTPEIVPLRHAGSCTLRWEVERHAAGTPMIDRIRIERLTEADSIRLAVEQELRRVLAAEMTATTTAAAAARLDPIVEASAAGADQLANLASRIHAVEAINAAGAALTAAAVMANPLEYPELQRTTATLAPLATGPALTQLESSAASLRGGFQRVRDTRGEGVLGSVAGAALGALIGDYRGAVQTTLTLLSGTRGRPLAAVADALGIRRRGRWQNEVQARLATLSTETHALLTPMAAHAERTQRRAARVQELATSARSLAAEADGATARLLREAGVDEERLPLFREAATKRADGRALSAEERAVLDDFALGLGAARDRAVAAGMDPTLTLAERLRTVLIGTERVHAAYPGLLAAQRQFFDEEIAYLCALQAPAAGALIGEETRRGWLTGAATAARAFAEARDAFQRAYAPTEPAPGLDPLTCPVLRA